MEIKRLHRPSQILRELSCSQNDIDKMNCYVYLDAHIFTAVLENYEILDFNSNWSQLWAYYIKLNKPKINDGLKASKELELFK